jgi:diguanylate cyclase (GGDEF)-like protein/PAS domain S-box-containing protein
MSRLLGVPIAFVALPDSSELRILAAHGLRESPVDTGDPLLADLICQVVLADSRPLSVDDVSSHRQQDDRSPDVLPEAGALLALPLRVGDGPVAGCVCAVADEPRVWTDQDIAMATDLIATVTSEIELRQAVADSEQRRSRHAALLDSPVRESNASDEQIRFYENVIDAVSQAVMLVSVDGRFMHWNRAAEELYGWSAEEVIGKAVFEFISPADRSTSKAMAILDAIAEGQSWSGEIFDRRRDGSEFPVYVTNSPIRSESGDLLGALVVATELSPIKETEEQLRLHSIMLEAVGQAVITTAPDGTITYWNRAAEEIYGWDADEVLGKHVLDIIPSPDSLEHAEAIMTSLSEGKSWSGEFRVRRRDGTVFPAYVTNSPIRNEDGDMIGIVGISADVSQLKTAEEQLRVHKLLCDAVGQAVVATDSSNRITYWNSAAEDLYGIPAEEAIGRNVLELYHRPGRWTGDSRMLEVFEALSSRGHFTGEVMTHNRDGIEIPVLVSAAVLYEDDAREYGTIMVLTDITERKQVEEALRESNRKIIEILERLTDGFIAVDHDGRLSYLNRQAEHLTQVSRDDVLGNILWDVFPEAAKLGFFDYYEEALETNRPVSFVEYYTPLEMWFEVHAYPSDDGLSVFFRDVTERRQAEQALREAEQRYRTLVEQLPAMTFTCDPNDVSKLLYVSPQIADVVGYTPEEWLESPSFWVDRLHPDDRELVLQTDIQSNRTGDSYSMEYRFITRDGRTIWVNDTGQLIRDEVGNPVVWQGISTNVTEYKLAEQQLRESEQRFRSLFDHHPDAVFSIDDIGRVLTANPAWEQITGYTRESFANWSFVRLVVPEDRDRVLKQFTLTRAGEPQTFQAAIVNRHDQRLDLNITSIPILVDGDIVGVHVVAQDVTLHQQLASQLAHQAYHDALTGLPNRIFFLGRLKQALRQGERSGMIFAVLFLDLDDFKIINDSLGHSAGDRLLVEVAQRIHTCIRTGDTLARFGGDEFTLLLEDIRDEREAVSIAERVSAVLDDPFDIDGRQVFITASTGIVVARDSSVSPDDILRNADLAMYEAKNAGKNRHALFEPDMNSRVWRRLTVESELRQALARQDFEVLFQPIVDIRTGSLDSLEALLRWRHPERGVLAPDQFVEVAEQSGLILPIGRWVFSEASRHVRAWRMSSRSARDLRLNLNLSARQYQHPRLIEELAEILAESNLSPFAVTLEIKESVAMDQSPATIEILRRLKTLGVRLALDDFGTGFSAFSHLKRFPIGALKIDQSFIDGLGVEAEDTTIVRAVIAAAQAMHLTVTAEGIETVNQLRLLVELGCHLGQGHLIAPPLTPEQIDRLLETDSFPWLESGLFTV